jgi:TRAP transporter TAXI family solute receptor
MHDQIRAPKPAAAIVVVLSVLTLLLAGCGGRQDRTSEPSAGGSAGACEATEAQLTIATGNSTGVYYVLGGGMASLISAETPIRATAAETGASVQNIQQLVDGTYDIAFSLADTAADAVTGKGSFTEPQPVRALGRIYSNYTQVVARKDSGITSIEDLRGKTVSTGSPKSGTEVIANRLLQSAGLDPAKDVKAQRLDLAKTVDGLKDGTIDAFFWSGGLPTPNLTDLFTSQPDLAAFIDITPQLPKLQEINSVYAEGTIPAATYNLKSDVKTIVVPNLLLVTDEFPANNACAITKLLWSSTDKLAQVHPSAKELDPKLAQDSAPVELAPGAKEALTELAGG